MAKQAWAGRSVYRAPSSLLPSGPEVRKCRGAGHGGEGGALLLPVQIDDIHMKREIKRVIQRAFAF